MAQITFDRRDFTGTFWIYHHPFQQGTEFKHPEPSQPVELPIGYYNLSISPGATINFGVNANGEAERADPLSNGITCDGKTISLNTVEVHIIPGAYKGHYEVTGAPWIPDKKSRCRLPKGVQELGTAHDAGYILEFAPSCAIRFNIDNNGQLGLNPNHYMGSAEIGPNNQLKLNSRRIQIAPDNKEIPWGLRGLKPLPGSSGDETFHLVPGVHTDGEGGGGYIIDVDYNGVNGRFGTHSDGTPYPSEVAIRARNGVVITFKLTAL